MTFPNQPLTLWVFKDGNATKKESGLDQAQGAHIDVKVGVGVGRLSGAVVR